MSVGKPNLPSSWGSAELHVQGTNIFGAAEAERISAQGINCGLFYQPFLALFLLDQTFSRHCLNLNLAPHLDFYVQGAVPLTAWVAYVVPLARLAHGSLVPTTEGGTSLILQQFLG